MKVHPLEVGPIIGHTTRSTVRLWGRGDRHGRDTPRRVFGVAQLKHPGKTVPDCRFFKMLPSFDFTGIVEFPGLKAGKSYQYRMGYVLAEMEPDEIHAANLDLDWGDTAWIDFQSAPGATGNTSFAFGSCRYLSRFGLFDNRGDKTFRAVLENTQKNPIDCMLMLGDQIYGDDLNFIAPSTRRSQFLKKYRRAFRQDHLRKLMSTVPTYMVLDDHEIRDNWSRDMMQDSAENRDIYEAAMGAYHSYQVVHGPAFQFSKNKREDLTPRRYWYAFDCGRSSFFVLDTRTERSEAENRMISEEQMQAFKGWMTKKSNKVKFVGTSVPFFPDKKNKALDGDKWSAFPQQRQEILEHIRKNKVQPIIFLTGDIHAAGWATVGCSTAPKLKIHHLISSPFYFPTAPGSRGRFENHTEIEKVGKNSYKVESGEFFTNKDNYSTVDVTGKGLTFRCFGRKNRPLGSKTITF